MKRRIFIAAIALLMVVLLAGCACEHNWLEATCSTPMVCTKCGETMGANGDHEWEDANCTTAKTCILCGITEGEPVHIWTDATCVIPKTCNLCGITEGVAHGHSMLPATCLQPETCSECGEVMGELGEHVLDEEKLCTVCGVEISKANPEAFTPTEPTPEPTPEAIPAQVEPEEPTSEPEDENTIEDTSGDGVNDTEDNTNIDETESIDDTTGEDESDDQARSISINFGSYKSAIPADWQVVNAVFNENGVIELFRAEKVEGESEYVLSVSSSAVQEGMDVTKLYEHISNTEGYTKQTRYPNSQGIEGIWFETEAGYFITFIGEDSNLYFVQLIRKDGAPLMEEEKEILSNVRNFFYESMMFNPEA